MSVSDLLSLAGFKTKFTSFHDIAVAQLSVLHPKPKTLKVQTDGRGSVVRPQRLVFSADTDRWIRTICRGKWKGEASVCLCSIQPKG